MNNLRILVGYEWKKLLKKKLVWISLLAVCLLEAFSNCSFLIQYYSVSAVDKEGEITEVVQYSGYEYLKQSMKFAKELEGRVVDNNLLGEAFEAGMQKDWEESEKYREIRKLLRQVFGYGREYEAYTVESFYGTWKENAVSQMKGSAYFTEEDNGWWEEKRDQVETPFIYRYAFGWQSLVSAIMGVSLFLAMAVGISLSDAFAEEHRRRMDQMILCTRNGKSRVYLAKMMAGVSFSGCCALLLYAIAAICCFGFQGAGGFDAALQLLQLNSPYPITVGQAALLLFGMLLLASILMSAAVMVLSELCNNNIAVLAIWVSVVLLTLLVEVPERWRVLSQAYSWLPLRMLDLSAFEDGRLVHLFGGRLTLFGITAILYPLLTALLGAAGYRKYRRFQVGG